MRRRPQQVLVRPITIVGIMRSPGFVRGVEEVRAGRRPHYDLDDWNYERGRQWAVVAPKRMPLRIGRRINPEAIAIYLKSNIP